MARLLASFAMVGGLSISVGACSGDIEPEAEALDEESPPTAMMPGVTNMGPESNTPEATPADGETQGEGASVGEGTPAVTGLDAMGEDAVEQPDEPEANEMQPVEMPATPLESLEVPVGEYCDAVADWDPEWVQFEEEVLLLVNEFRSEPADCGTEGQFPAAGPLSMDPILRCSSRLHSLDMFDQEYFDHVNLDGVDPFERMAAAGFSGGGGGENIALGQRTPEEVMGAWMESDGHCSNVMRANYSIIGVGYHPGAGQRGLGSNYWTQNFGAPRLERGRPAR